MLLTPPTTDENGKALPQIVAAILVENGAWEPWVEGAEAQALLYDNGRVWIANKWQAQIVNVKYVKRFLKIKADLAALPKASKAVGEQPDAIALLKASHFGIVDPPSRAKLTG